MKGHIFFISGPSGVGKGTLIQALQERHPEWSFPKSFSTRKMRSYETQGNPYFFISREKFKEKIENQEFLEYAFVHNSDFYGTDRDSIITPAQNGKIVIKEFDVQGYQQIMKKLDKSIYTSIFLKVKGGVAELIQRIQKRSPMSQEEIQFRMLALKKELALEKEYDYTIVNNVIENMVREAEEIIQKNS